jgi:hypothetical protein
MKNTNWDLRTKEGKLRFASLVAQKKYPVAKIILQEWLRKNPHDESKKFKTSINDFYGRLWVMLDLAESNDLARNYKNGKLEGMSIFSDGNDKLKFLNYSTFPIVTCPGAGACKSFCYSLNSLRYPGAFTRWLMNTILENEAPELIADAFAYKLKNPTYQKELKEKGFVTFRLYNDGDFPNLQTMGFWFKLLKRFPEVKAYGYSKSWGLFIRFVEEFGQDAIPRTYKLNLSSGANGMQELLRKKISSYNFVRGDFIAIPLPGNKKKNVTKINNDEKKYIYKVAKEQGHKKVMICGGLCNSCTRVGHACGSEVFDEYAIVIPIHG